MAKDILIVDKDERIHRWTERKDCFRVQIFRDRQEPPDPAGLCDGGDYVCQFQLRMDNDGGVYCSWQDSEHGELHVIGFATYRDFYEKVTHCLKGLTNGQTSRG